MTNIINSTKIELISVDALVPYLNNTRTHSEEQIQQISKSIETFGFTNPILIDAQDEVIAGHGRLLGAKLLGLIEVPCIRLKHLSPAQKKAYVIADNKIAENAGWDEQLLATELKELEELDFNVSTLGFDDKELSNLFDELAQEQTVDEIDEIPKSNGTSKVKLGDVWILGDHRLMCGSATNLEDAKKLTENKKVDLLLTDPPYNVGYVGKTKEQLIIKNDSMNNEKFKEFLTSSLKVGNEYLKQGGVFYIWHATSEAVNFILSANAVGWQVRQSLVWRKNVFVLGRQDYHWQHEPCLYGWKDGAAHYWGGDRKQTTVLDFDKPLRNDIHPTMKPVLLFEHCIKNSSKIGEIVLDLFGGSGTTIIACERLNRRAFIMELDDKYCDAIIHRWQELTGKVAVLEPVAVSI